MSLIGADQTWEELTKCLGVLGERWLTELEL